jgi:hypothetical protein
VTAILGDDTSVTDHWKAPGYSEIEIIVVSGCIRSVEASHRAQAPPRKEHRRSGQYEAALQERQVVIAMNEQLIRSFERLTFGSDVATRTDRTGRPAIALERFYPYLNRPVQEPVVRIEEDEQPSSTFRNAPIPSRRCALMRLATIMNGGIPLHYSPRVVRRSVINHERLDVSVTLTANALERLAEKVCLVITGDDDRHERIATLVVTLGFAHRHVAVS